MKKLGFLFPGQGSQSVGMLNGMLEDRRFTFVIRDVLDRADLALCESLSSMIAQGPVDSLNLTVNTQPAMLAADVALYEAWRQQGGSTPSWVAGHSLGEYAALTVAKSFIFEDAIKLVKLRATAMQAAVPVGQGSMAAILGLSDEQVIAICRQANQPDSVVQAVNFNAPAQVIIAGSASAVDRVCNIAKTAGAKRVLPLAVSAPFHSTLMKPVGQVLTDALKSLVLNSPVIPYINNVDVQSPTQPAAISDALSRQAWQPVRWVETIKSMQAAGVTHFVECGPGKVLAGLVKRITDLPVFAMYDPASLDAALVALT